ncbi:MAG: MurR/RpiR family transcriptional regulator [Rhodobacteraceae bacterium]|nr:MurR/RpiR family transcriptional regulator [Paracoccaceae bacterium]
MARTLLEDIHEKLDEFTATERKAARALLANYPLQGLGTVAQFADAAGVSSPTILRFVARLGFAGFAGFQEHLRQELQSQLNTPLARSSVMAGKSENSSDPLLEALIDNLRETFANLPSGNLNSLIKLLADDRRPVHMIGGRFTDGLARYMAAHLRIVRSNVHHVAGQQGNWLDQLIDIGSRDVIVVFDIRRYQEEIIRFSKAAAKQGATIALITDSWMSPVGKFASFVLPSRVAVPSAWDSSLALMAIAEVLIAGVTSENAGRSQERMQALEQLRDADSALRSPED